MDLDDFLDFMDTRGGEVFAAAVAGALLGPEVIEGAKRLFGQKAPAPVNAKAKGRAAPVEEPDDEDVVTLKPGKDGVFE